MARPRKRGSSPVTPARRRSLFREVDEKALALDQGRQLNIFGQTVERANDGVVVTDLENVISYANPACERMTGWPRAELLGRSAAIFTEGAPGQDTGRILSVVRAGGAWRGEVEFVRKNGERFYVDLAVFPVTDDRGKALSTISIQRDVTPRRRLLLELEASEVRYRQLFDAASDMIFLTDPDGALLRINAATASGLGRSAEELFGRRLAELVIDEQRALIEALLGRLRSGERTVYADLVLTAGVGRRQVEASLSVRGKEGAFEGLVGICRDVTERQRLQEAVQAAARLRDLGRFASTVAHEIRNPLSSVKIAVQALERSGAPLDEKDRRRLTIAAREIASMERTLHEILDFVGSSQPALEPNDLGSLVQEAIESVEHEIRDRGVALAFRKEPLRPVLTDGVRAKRAIANVCLNAAQGMSAGGQVDVEVGPGPGGTGLVRVLDRGPGVPQEIKAHIFEPFVTFRARGTGLGLAVVKKVMDEHGGAVEIVDRDGGGAVFTLKFQGAPSEPQ